MNNHLNAILCKIKSVWYDFIDTLVSGSCGCHRPVKMYYKTLVQSCNDLDDRLGMFSINTCTTSEEVSDETEDMPVFFSNTRFPNGVDIYIPSGQIKILTTSANIVKLQKADDIEVEGEKYDKIGNPEPIGWDNEYTFYSMTFKKKLNV